MSFCTYDICRTNGFVNELINSKNESEVKIMPKVCSICGKGKLSGKAIAHSHSHVSKRTNRQFKPNLQKVKLEDENGTVRTECVCTKCLKKVN